MGHNYAHAHLLCIIVQQVCCPTTRVPLAERRPTYPTPSDATGSTTAPLRSPMTGWPEKTWTGGTLWRRSAPTQVCSLCLPAAASTTRTWTAALADSSSIHVSPSSAFLLIQTHERFERTLFIRTKTQSANFRGNPLYISSYKTTLKQTVKRWKTMKNEMKS